MDAEQPTVDQIILACKLDRSATWDQLLQKLAIPSQYESSRSDPQSPLEAT